MNETNLPGAEAKLAALLRTAHPNPDLPPRFQENVWRRIERPELTATASRLATLAGWLVRPRLALAVATVLVLVAGGLGWNNGERRVQTEAQARYLAAVAPNALH